VQFVECISAIQLAQYLSLGRTPISSLCGISTSKEKDEIESVTVCRAKKALD